MNINTAKVNNMSLTREKLTGMIQWEKTSEQDKIEPTSAQNNHEIENIDTTSAQNHEIENIEASSTAQNHEVENIKPTNGQSHDIEHAQNHKIEQALNPTGLCVDSSIHHSFLSLLSDTLFTSTDKKNINELRA